MNKIIRGKNKLQLDYYFMDFFIILNRPVLHKIKLNFNNRNKILTKKTILLTKEIIMVI